MPVPTSINDLSTTAASNSPAGTDTVTSSTGPDEYFRAHAAIVRRLHAKGADVASAATVDLGAINDGTYVKITGTTTITSFGTIAAGVERTLLFADALTLTHDTAKIIIPGAANITTAAGDVTVVISEGGGLWRVLDYQRAAAISVASDVKNTPAGNITATTVQAAINELDTELSKLPAKASCRVATTANITLSGEQTIDGVAVVAGDRVLVKDQTAGAENGIYVAATGAWARAEDANGAGDLTSGVLVPVETGTSNADTIWMLTTDGAITIGTTALTWQIKSGDASTTRKGLVQLATSAEAQALTDALKALTPATLAAALQGGNQSLAPNGYQKLPGGLIIQWATVSTDASGQAVFTFPISFPTEILRDIPYQQGKNYIEGASAVSNSGLTYTLRTIDTSALAVSVPVGLIIVGH